MSNIVKDVFKDYKGQENILEAQIENINLFKKSKKIEIKLLTKKQIKIQEISSFEEYLKTRFQIQKVELYIEFGEKGVRPLFHQQLANDWKDIIGYISKKFPLTKAILNTSTVEVEDNKVIVDLKTKSADFLHSYEIDKEIEQVVNNLYGVKCKVIYKENVTEETIKKQEEYLENLQKEACQDLINEISMQEEMVVENVPDPEEEEQEEKTPLIFGRTDKIKEQIVKIEDLTSDYGRVAIEGKVISTDVRELKNGKTLAMFNIYDGTSTITCKSFVEAEKAPTVLQRLKEAKRLKISGNAQYDNFAKELGVIANIIIEMPDIEVIRRKDNAKEKRVELHLHTQMSQMDGVSSATDLIKRASNWGMKSIAITDHGVVQAFPEAKKAADKYGIKVVYGVEAYLVPDDNAVDLSNGMDNEYIVLDIETTGLSFRTEKITEIGAVRVKDGEIVDTFECFVNPEIPIPQKIVEITHITDDMVKDAETIDKVMPKFLEFIGDLKLVAHNADFDVGFLKYNAEELGLTMDNEYIDSLALSRQLFPDFKKHKLGIIAEKLGIKVENAHRALDDVKTLVKVFLKMLEIQAEEPKKGRGKKKEEKKELYKTLPSYHAIILVKNLKGLRNLYELISVSHLNYFYKKPRILTSVLEKYKEGLILGSACEQGELYRAIVAGKSEEEIERIAKRYDYLEIQPLGNNEFMLRNGTVGSKEELQDINRKIVELGDKLGKKTVATCDVHFLDPEDEIYRRILMAGQGFSDADEQAPLYLRTTEEMLKEFEYLGREKAYEVVVTNTNYISDLCEEISPISPEKCPPVLENAERDIQDICTSKAKELYGDPLPQVVQDRLKRELDSIIKNGFSTLYIIAQRLVWKSNEDGYLVGSRGSVGSSFVANMLGITEVNSLPPHYRCPNCKYSDFTDYGIKNGVDLPDKICPKCGAKLFKDGMDIPFETFLGFNGDKEPDIDLNFSGEYQSKIHRYAEVIFGKGKTFKAGTVGTIADKTAFGYVKNYFEERNIPVTNAEISRIVMGCTGVKRTTGQHPGGIIVVPHGREIYEFTPVQHPADDPNSDIITTHFDYHSIDKNLLKLDMLGHDDPTVIRMLQDLTGVDPKTIPLDDKKTMSLFTSTKALGVEPEQIGSKTGSFGIPEFGTKFVRGMLEETKPTTFEELIRISRIITWYRCVA